jgi:hypothetical protein
MEDGLTAVGVAVRNHGAFSLFSDTGNSRPFTPFLVSCLTVPDLP